jgi:hypothetical protein
MIHKNNHQIYIKNDQHKANYDLHLYKWVKLKTNACFFNFQKEIKFFFAGFFFISYSLSFCSKNKFFGGAEMDFGDLLDLG